MAAYTIFFVFGAICKDVKMVGLKFYDITELIMVSAWTGFCFGELNLFKHRFMFFIKEL